jgi:hypothetical protein
MSDTRKFLTPEERLRCAYAHYILGIDQQHIAMLMAVNSGRVNEACKGIETAMNNPKGVRVPMEKPELPVVVSWRPPEPVAEPELPLSLDQVVLSTLVTNGGVQ